MPHPTNRPKTTARCQTVLRLGGFPKDATSCGGHAPHPSCGGLTLLGCGPWAHEPKRGGTCKDPPEVVVTLLPGHSDPGPIAPYLHTGAREMHTTDITAAVPRWALTTGTLITVAVLAACSTSGNGAKPSSSNNSGRTSAIAVELTSAQLAVNLKSTSIVTSAHITMSSTVGSQTILTAEGDETAAGGKLTAMNLNEQIGSSNMTILLTGGALYVKLPSSLNKSGKPWEKATAGSSNPVLKQLASTLSSIEQSASLDQYGSLAQ